MNKEYLRGDEGGDWSDSDLREHRRQECSSTGDPQDPDQDPHDTGTLGVRPCVKPETAAWAGISMQ